MRAGSTLLAMNPIRVIPKSRWIPIGLTGARRIRQRTAVSQKRTGRLRTTRTTHPGRTVARARPISPRSTPWNANHRRARLTAIPSQSFQLTSARRGGVRRHRGPGARVAEAERAEEDHGSADQQGLDQDGPRVVPVDERRPAGAVVDV